MTGNPTRAPRRLRRRLVIAFAAFAVLVASVFGLYTVVFMYTVEDSVFNHMLEREAQRQHDAPQPGGWLPPLDPAMRIHVGIAQLPEDLRPALQHEPWRHEVAGTQGRHYHVRRLTHADGREPAWLVAEVSDQLVVRPVRTHVLLLLGVTGLVVLALAVLLGAWLARRSTRALDRLVDHVQQLTPSRRSVGPITGVDSSFEDDEIGVLAHALDGLGARVNAFVVREHAFTRDASHELRTPLSVISSAAQQLLGEPHLTVRGRQHLLHIRQSALQLQHALSTLLALAREEQPPAQAPAPRVLPVLERVIVEQAPLLEERDVDVQVEVADDATLRVDATALQLVLANLVGNAFAHTRTGQIRIAMADGVLSVRNPGNPAEATQRWPRPQPFDKGARSSGSGLGLEIVRRLCDHHRLRLSLEADACGVHARLQEAGESVAHPSG